MNDSFPVTIKHPNGLRRAVMSAARTTTSAECVRALIRSRFLPRESAVRRYALTRADGRRLCWGEPLGASENAERGPLQVVVVGPRCAACR